MKKNQKGFTLMELMVVIVIVAILAAVAVPLYINYVKDAQSTEAKGAIGAIITAEQAAYQRSAVEGTPTYLTYDKLVEKKLVDVSEADLRWNFSTPVASANAYQIKAIYAPGGTVADPVVSVTYSFRRATDGDPGESKFLEP